MLGGVRAAGVGCCREEGAARGFPQRKGGMCGSVPSPASICPFLSAPFFKPVSWISSSFPQPVCYPCEVSQGGSVIASPPVGSWLYIRHSRYVFQGSQDRGWDVWFATQEAPLGG